jgi:hypothetical protein
MEVIMQYTVRNWRKFQHYKDRNPPWIKLHFELLSSSDWVMLDDASRVLAVAIMLVASRNDGEIDGLSTGLDYLQRVAYLRKRPNLKPLIDCGFLEPASGCKQTLADARPETETETEDIKKEEKTRSTKGSRLSLDSLPDEWRAWTTRHDISLNAGEIFEVFRDYYISKPGQKGVMLNWFATWRNWVKRQKEFVKPKGNGAGTPTLPAKIDNCAGCGKPLLHGHTKTQKGKLCSPCWEAR